MTADESPTRREFLATCVDAPAAPAVPRPPAPSSWELLGMPPGTLIGFYRGDRLAWSGVADEHGCARIAAGEIGIGDFSVTVDFVHDRRLGMLSGEIGVGDFSVTVSPPEECRRPPLIPLRAMLDPARKEAP